MKNKIHRVIQVLKNWKWASIITILLTAAGVVIQWYYAHNSSIAEDRNSEKLDGMNKKLYSIEKKVSRIALFAFEDEMEARVAELSTNATDLTISFCVTNYAKTKSDAFVKEIIAGRKIDKTEIEYVVGLETPRFKLNAPILLPNSNEAMSNDVKSIYQTTKMRELEIKSIFQFATGDYETAYDTARKAWKHCQELMTGCKSYVSFDPALQASLLHIIPILIDGLMAECDYDGMIQLANQYDGLCADPSMYAKAIRDIAALKKSGGFLIFFSPKELKELRKLGKANLLDYLNILARKGYIQAVEIEAQKASLHPFSHRYFFGIDEYVGYVKMFRAEVIYSDGKTEKSNIVTAQWGGLGKIIKIDVEQAIRVALGVPEEHRPDYEYEIDVRFEPSIEGPVESGEVELRRTVTEEKIMSYLSDLVEPDDEIVPELTP